MEIYQIEIQAEDSQALVLRATSHSLEPIREKHLKNLTFYNHMTSVHFLKEETLIRKIQDRQDL